MAAGLLACAEFLGPPVARLALVLVLRAEGGEVGARVCGDAVSALGGRSAARDDLTGSGAGSGLRIPDLDLDELTLGDDETVLSVGTGVAAEGDGVVGPGRDVTRDRVAAIAVSEAASPSGGEITDLEVRRITGRHGVPGAEAAAVYHDCLAARGLERPD